MHRPGIVAATQDQRNATASAFDDPDVARCYAQRPPYAPALFKALLGRVPGRARALDLGCGPGKIAISLADHFDEVVALDISPAMIAAGRDADAGGHPNITWIAQAAEDHGGGPGFDLVAAGTSIHWPDHAVLFPRLAAWTPIVAIIAGDAPTPPPCGEAAWTEFLVDWIARVGGRYDLAASTVQGTRHEAWMDIAGRETFAFTFRQSVEDFISAQHSRATWSRAVMGQALAAEFDLALDGLMRPFAVDGLLDLPMVSELTWGAPRTTPRG